MMENNNNLEKITITKKRKLDFDKDQLKSEAQSLCDCPEQWTLISKYNLNKMKDWVQEKRFAQDRKFQNTVFEGVHKLYALAIDFISKGNGFIERQLLEDEALKESLEVELTTVLKYLNNKSRILFLTANDGVQGKMIQKKTEKNETATIVEEFPLEEIKKDVEQTTKPIYESDQPEVIQSKPQIFNNMEYVDLPEFREQEESDETGDEEDEKIHGYY